MNDDSMADLLRHGIQALNDGNAKAADSAGRKLMVRSPGDPAVQQFMASLRLAQGRLAEAEQFITAALLSHPNHAGILALAGRIARMAGNLDLAAYRFRQSADSDPQRRDSPFQASVVLIERGGVELRPLLEDLLLRFPDYSAGWAEIGDALERTGQPEVALAAYSQAAKSTRSAAIQTRRGSLLHQLGRYDEALEALEMTLSIDPAFVLAWFKLGLVRQDQHDLPGAADAYRQALTLKPDLVEAETNLGMVLQESGDLLAAKQAYGRAILMQPESFGRIAQAMTMAPVGELWLDLGALRNHLRDAGRLSR